MKLLIKLNIIILSILIVSCVTNDFKVVDELQKGMTSKEARSIIASYQFERAEILTRPESGWPETDGTFTNLPGRAKVTESTLNIEIKSAEYYPVGHGLLGFGQLFLFYDNNGKLAYFYRRQIN